VGVLAMQLTTAKEMTWRLDLTKESRPLLDPERVLRRHLKSSYFGMPTKKLKLRQRSSVTWIRLGDANSKLFHERVNRHRRKNFI
jgi:hypothetical protein